MAQGLDGRSRSGRVTAALADDLLSRGAGDRLPTMAEYSRRFGVGNGSIEKALRLLQDHGAVRVEARGHLGSFLLSSDIGALWTASGKSALVGAVPRPTSTEFEGIVAGLVEGFARQDVPFTPYFVSGSRFRLNALLRARVQFIVMSEDAAEQARRLHPISIVSRLHPESFYPEGSIVVVTRSDLDDPQAADRVAIDLASHDHETLTRTQFGEREFVDVPYLLITDRLADGTVDAAVWHRTSRSTLSSAPGWRLHPVATPATQEVLKRMSRGVVVSRDDDAPLKAVIEASVAPDLVLSAQSEIREGRHPSQFWIDDSELQLNQPKRFGVAPPAE